MRAPAIMLVSLAMLLSHAQGAIGIEFGYAHLQTVQGSHVSGGTQEMQPGIVVRLFSKDGKREVFALSNRDGVALVPLRPGAYCFQAFDQSGTPLKLDANQAACFALSKSQTLEVGVVLAARR